MDKVDATFIKTDIGLTDVTLNENLRFLLQHLEAPFAMLPANWPMAAGARHICFGVNTASFSSLS